jgi:glycosyltransferase involved in cell wall biosynthesis
VRPYNLILNLQRAGHKVTLLSLVSEDYEREGLNLLKDAGVQIHVFPLPRWRSLLNSVKALPGRDPIQSHYCWQPDLARMVLSLVNNPNPSEKFDVFHIEHLRGVQYGTFLKKHQKKLEKPILPIIWDSVDCISYLFQQSSSKSNKITSRLISRLELDRTRRLESNLVGFFDQMLVTSRTDRNAFMELAPLKSDTYNITVLPNGVDLEYFSVAGDDKRQQATLVVSGKMSYHANVTMVVRLINEIMPQVWQKKPGARLWVVGKDPPKEIKQLGADERIKITGTVSDIRPFLQQATIAVAPISYGAGIQNKVLEAMACGTPVVASRQAVSALSTRPGLDCMVAEDSSEFAHAIVNLLDDHEKRNQLGIAGRKYVETFHDWSAIIKELENVYKNCLKLPLPDSQV